MKNIVAFVNTLGGEIFIGVNDKGEIIGLEPDYIKFNKKVEESDKMGFRDSYKLFIDDAIANWIGNDIRIYLDVLIYEINHKDICLIKVNKREGKKIYSLSHSIDKNTKRIVKNKKCWYYRGEAGAREYTMEDIISAYNVD